MCIYVHVSVDYGSLPEGARNVPFLKIMFECVQNMYWYANKYVCTYACLFVSSLAL